MRLIGILLTALSMGLLYFFLSSDNINVKFREVDFSLAIEGCGSVDIEIEVFHDKIDFSDQNSACKPRYFTNSEGISAKFRANVDDYLSAGDDSYEGSAVIENDIEFICGSVTDNQYSCMSESYDTSTAMQGSILTRVSQINASRTTLTFKGISQYLPIQRKLVSFHLSLVGDRGDGHIRVFLPEDHVIDKSVHGYEVRYEGSRQYIEIPASLFERIGTLFHDDDLRYQVISFSDASKDDLRDIFLIFVSTLLGIGITLIIESFAQPIHRFQ